MKKIRILFNWYYHRKDWIEYLLPLNEEVKIFFLYKFLPDESEKEIRDFFSGKAEILYWSDFKSPYEILDKIKPDKVIFHDIESFNQLALNVAAKNSGIKTYVLQHGLRGDYEINDALKHAGENNKIELSETSWWTLKFLIKSLRLKNFRSIFSLFKFILSRKKNELTVALYKNQFELRRADYYIEFSKENATYHKIRDGIPENRFFFIGNPYYDDFYARIKTIFLKTVKEQYALLIDSPFCEANFVQKQRMSLVEKNIYIKKLNEYSKNKQLKLYIKLHPISYATKGLYEEENIKYFKEAVLTELIAQSQIVFLVHFTTLAPLILHQKPFIFFHNQYIEKNNFVSSLPIQTFDLLNFDPLELAKQKPYGPLDISILEDHLFKTDGKAAERLKQILFTGSFNEAT